MIRRGLCYRVDDNDGMIMFEDDLAREIADQGGDGHGVLMLMGTCEGVKGVLVISGHVQRSMLK